MIHPTNPIAYSYVLALAGYLKSRFLESLDGALVIDAGDSRHPLYFRLYLG